MEKEQGLESAPSPDQNRLIGCLAPLQSWPTCSRVLSLFCLGRVSLVRRPGKVSTLPDQPGQA